MRIGHVVKDVYGLRQLHADAADLIGRGERLARITEAALTQGRTCRRGEDF